MFSINPLLINLTFTSCLCVQRSYPLIPDIIIIESTTMATNHFGHFTSVTVLLIWVELIYSFDLFLCDRLYWCVLFKYFKIQKMCMFFFSNFLQLCFQLSLVNCLFISAIIVFFSISDFIVFVVAVIVVLFLQLLSAVINQLTSKIKIVLFQ